MRAGTGSGEVVAARRSTNGAATHVSSGVLAGMVVQFVTGAGDRRVLGTALAGLALLFVVVLRVATCA